MAGRAQAVRRLELRDFRNYAHVALAPAPRPDRAAWRQRRRQDQPAGGGLAAEPGPRPARRQARRDRPQRRRRISCCAPMSTGIWARSRSRPATTATPSAAARWPTASRCAARTRWASIVSLLWLTPAMDRLFAEGAAGRRRFLDRLVLAIDAGPRRARRRLRARARASARTCCAPAAATRPGWARIEQRIAEAGGRRHRRPPRAGGRPRRRAGTRPSTISRARASSLVGELESWLDELPALDAEQRLAERAGREPRARTPRPAAPRSGPHRSDLEATDAATRRGRRALLDRPPEGLS